MTGNLDEFWLFWNTGKRTSVLAASCDLNSCIQATQDSQELNIYDVDDLVLVHCFTFCLLASLTLFILISKILS